MGGHSKRPGVWQQTLLALLLTWPASHLAAASVPQKVKPGSEVNFNRDIRPIFSENCYGCHGPDENRRKAGLRFDQKDGAFKQLKSGDFAIVPGDLTASKLVYRITASDEDDRMPPLKTGKHLTPRQIDLLRRWIAQGAQWQGHWAYLKPQRPPLPPVKNKRWLRNEIDAFILARLEKEGLNPSCEADKVTLIRRVTFDLTGLPPTLAEVDAFVADPDPDAYERLVDRLLASPALGERMAEFWLDLARYADTNGYHIDNHRDMWEWRQWVINAFNANMPFDEFTVEQLAGDMLPHAALEQKIASGFNRNCMVNFEGGADPDEYATKYIVDRVDTTAIVWLGTTLGCAECHDHKYDPFSQKEFYQFYAFFNNVPEKGLDGSKSNPVPSLKVPSPAQQARLEEKKQAVAALEAKLKQRLEEKNPALEAAQAAWEERLTQAVLNEWSVVEPLEASSENGATLTRLPDQSVLASGKNPDTDTYTISLQTPLKDITGLRLEALTHESLTAKGVARSDNGNFVLTGLEVEAERAPSDQPEPEPEPAAFGVWHALGPFKAPDVNAGFGRPYIEEPKVDLGKTYADGTLRWTEKPDWKDGEIHKLTGDVAATYLYRTITVKTPRPMLLSLGSDDGIQVWLNGQKLLSKDVSRAVAPDQEKVVAQLSPGENQLLLKINNRGGDYAFYFKPERQLPTNYPVAFAAAIADYSQKDFSVQAALDKKPDSGWAVDGHKEGNRVNRQAIFLARQPFGFAAGTRLKVRLKFGSKFKQHTLGRFRLALSSATNLTELGDVPAKVQSFWFKPPDQRAADQKTELTKYYRGRSVPEIVQLDKDLIARRDELKKFDDSIPQTMVMEEMDKPRDTFILIRGNFQNKGEKVTADVPRSWPPLPVGAPKNRLTLARWLVSPDHPLTSRVTVNRFWQMLFGTGLVKTSNDFGSQGDWPSHPELLDWLACEFRDGPDATPCSSPPLPSNGRGVRGEGLGEWRGVRGEGLGGSRGSTATQIAVNAQSQHDLLSPSLSSRGGEGETAAASPASDRRPQAWDIKHLLRLIVTSATYRQSAVVTPSLLERDPYNRLLARGPRFRMDAEMIRDSALAVSGLLNRKLGGESVRPYQPPGLWEAMAFGGEFSSQTYVQSHGPDLYRRGIYIYWKRSVPYPSLITFDAPSREVCTAQRPRTTTPLQALVLMNDPAFVEAARGLAERVLKEGGHDIQQRLVFAFRLVLARAPSKQELQILQRVYQQELENFRKDKKAAADLVSIGESARPAGVDVSELAAWTALGNLLLNLDETITKG